MPCLRKRLSATVSPCPAAVTQLALHWCCVLGHSLGMPSVTATEPPQLCAASQPCSLRGSPGRRGANRAGHCQAELARGDCMGRSTRSCSLALSLSHSPCPGCSFTPFISFYFPGHFHPRVLQHSPCPPCLEWHRRKVPFLRPLLKDSFGWGT